MHIAIYPLKTLICFSSAAVQMLKKKCCDINRNKGGGCAKRHTFNTFTKAFSIYYNNKDQIHCTVNTTMA